MMDIKFAYVGEFTVGVFTVGVGEFASRRVDRIPLNVNNNRQPEVNIKQFAFKLT